MGYRDVMVVRAPIAFALSAVFMLTAALALRRGEVNDTV